MKSFIRYDYTGGFYIYHIWCSKSDVFRWNMSEDQLSRGAYYKGKLRITECANPSILGHVFNGFYDFSVSPQYNEVNQYMHCIADTDMEWWCLHKDIGSLSVQYIPLSSKVEVPINTSVIILEGSANFSIDSVEKQANQLNHIKPKASPYILTGSAKLFFIQ